MFPTELNGIKGPVNIYWGVGTGAKGDRTYTFFAKIMIGRKLFLYSTLIGHQLFYYHIGTGQYLWGSWARCKNIGLKKCCGPPCGNAQKQKLRKMSITKGKNENVPCSLFCPQPRV